MAGVLRRGGQDTKTHTEERPQEDTGGGWPFTTKRRDPQKNIILPIP